MAKRDGWIARADTDLDADTGNATARVDLEAFPGWQIEADVDGVTSGTPVLRALRLQAPEGKAVTTRALAAVPTGAILRAISEDLAMLAGSPSGNWRASPAMARDVRRWVKGLDTASKTGRARNADVFYAQLAIDYETIAHTSATPTKDLAEKYGVTYARMKNLLSEAGYRGFLVRRQGVAGGRATDAARNLLEGTN